MRSSIKQEKARRCLIVGSTLNQAFHNLTRCGLFRTIQFVIIENISVSYLSSFGSTAVASLITISKKQRHHQFQFIIVVNFKVIIIMILFFRPSCRNIHLLWTCLVSGMVGCRQGLDILSFGCQFPDLPNTIFVEHVTQNQWRQP